ncbi:DUF2523 family protein [Vibrio vulnificus]|jgi:hypothetical protein|uniref:DUF2523 domain-containing protein n=1 Tax=Vibrio vulnificus TaxID=672 RepID=A0A2S3R4U4_VIBVL|nr:DUF2523 family protein [Vibrio vulnificus]POB48706.1 hypothetical protein CRN52_07925 [Vibrio vulnificus]POB76041.1 hypothetical protein CRN30_24030 [Vibrio vulnificus]
MLDWFVDRWNDFIDFTYRVVMTVFDALKDVLFWLVESLLDLVIFAIDGMGNMFNGLDFTQYINALPPETKQMLALTGISDAMSMVVACILIRILLQLIPFVRLGS